MLSFLPAAVRGTLAFVLLGLNTLAWALLLLALAVVKLLLPLPAVRRRIDPLLNGIATAWIACNSGWMRLTQRTVWDVQGTQALQPGGWHLVICNHQSWVDILVLQRVLSRRIPLLKFFLKQQLIYVPVIGLAWWALDFPFLRRHGKAALRAHPELRLQDRDTTRRACAKFSLVPTSVMSFPEGTRFTPAKHQRQQSPHAHLLKPKAGALAMALDAMGSKFRSLVDVTIVYPGGAPSFWAFACGRVPAVRVRVHLREIPPELAEGDYTEDAAFRSRFHGWLAGLWQQKDEEIAALLGAAGSAAQPPASASEPQRSGVTTSTP
jgi:1-acyl-sn-glycerol-3-phosphate acyltransferase